MCRKNAKTLFKSIRAELKTLEWAILNADRLINPEINNKRRTGII